jgi:predicted enzyme related to lactoylglutathione lyase
MKHSKYANNLLSIKSGEDSLRGNIRFIRTVIRRVGPLFWLLCTKEKSIMNEKINYVEYPARDIEATKQFFSAAFDWSFVDYGPDYTSFSNQGLDGGFFRSELTSTTKNGGALLVLLSDDLETCEIKVKAAGGIISQEIFSFPGGRRFHFIEPSGNELAVWTHVGA